MLKTKITSIMLHSLIHWQLNGYPEGKNNFTFDTFFICGQLNRYAEGRSNLDFDTFLDRWAVK